MPGSKAGLLCVGVVTFYSVCRYGSPGGVVSDYEDFARWYLKTFSAGILDVLLQILGAYRSGSYVSPRVMQQALNYLTQAVGHGVCWTRLKPHATTLIQEVLFPFLSYSEADRELWDSDPHEYIRVKFGESCVSCLHGNFTQTSLRFYSELIRGASLWMA